MLVKQSDRGPSQAKLNCLGKVELTRDGRHNELCAASQHRASDKYHTVHCVAELAAQTGDIWMKSTKRAVVLAVVFGSIFVVAAARAGDVKGKVSAEGLSRREHCCVH